MADLFDYLQWRGDIPFSQVPTTPVDNLIFSALVYIDFGGIVGEELTRSVPLKTAAEEFFALPDRESRIRVKNDIKLLQAISQTRRFRDVRLTFYRNRLIPEEQTQFAAISFLLPDGSAFLAFRGTDYSLVGWKEDFNMSFQDTVPAQREALAYTQEFAGKMPMIMRLGGHSKGGNLAVFAAAKAGYAIQHRIITIYNNDGPGFTEYLMGDPGYLAVVPKIRTYIPESSVIGILLEHEEDYRVIKSRQLGPLQHELYSWEIMGGDFIYTEELSDESKFLDKAIKSWIKDMTKEERGHFIDTVYEMLSASGASTVQELIQPQNVLSFFRQWNTDDRTRRLLTGELTEFLKAAGSALTGPKS